MSQKLSGIEHQVIKPLKAARLPKRWLLAVSGGLDSVVMAEILNRWRRHLGVELAIAHVHHGLTGGAQDTFRAEAQDRVRTWARLHKLRFITLKAKPRGLKSEAELRHLRHRTLQKWRVHFGYDLIVLAHHRDDLLETRMLRLIRGSGPQGLLAMSFQSQTLLRPLLSIERAQLEHYARTLALQWSEDPTNAQSDAFRNWLRNEWLPVLESKRQGALKSLSRSLEILAPASTETRLGNYVGLRRKDIGRVPLMRQQTIVAEYLKALGVQGYGRSHVEEILKRLATPRREFLFTMLGFNFRVTPDLLWASRV